jgi:hypothetical protein
MRMKGHPHRRIAAIDVGHGHNSGSVVADRRSVLRADDADMPRDLMQLPIGFPDRGGLVDRDDETSGVGGFRRRNQILSLRARS